MFVTLAVLKLRTSRLVRPEQPRNMAYIFVTLAVLKLLTSRLVRLRQSSNMLCMVVTFTVFRYSIPSIDVKALKFWNQLSVLVIDVH